MIKLSHRLQNIFDMINPRTTCVWDICCDHGYLGIASSKFFNKVILLDSVQSITSSIPTDIPRVDILNQDATEYNFANKYYKNTYVLAGIGDDLTIKILNNLIPNLKENDEIILNCHKNITLLRKFLMDKNFKLLEERLVEDKSQFYELIKVDMQSSSDVSQYGENFWNENIDISRRYLENRICYAKNRINFHVKAKEDLNNYLVIAHKLSLSLKI